MSSSCWDEGSDSDRTGEPELEVRGLVGHRKISPGNEAKLPRSAREEAVKVRPFPGGKRLTASGARALKWARRVGTQRRYVVPRVDESKSSHNNPHQTPFLDPSESRPPDRAPQPQIPPSDLSGDGLHV